MKTLADRMTSRMKELDITQDELARKVSLSQVAIQKIATGKTAHPKKILEIAKALDVTPEWLAYGNDEQENNEAPQQLTDKSFGIHEMQEAMEIAKLWLELPPDQRAVLKITAKAFIHSAQKQTSKVA